MRTNQSRNGETIYLSVGMGAVLWILLVAAIGSAAYFSGLRGEWVGRSVIAVGFVIAFLVSANWAHKQWRS